MNKEQKLGIALVGMLATATVGALAVRLRNGSEVSAAEKVQEASPAVAEQFATKPASKLLDRMQSDTPRVRLSATVGDDSPSTTSAKSSRAASSVGDRYASIATPPSPPAATPKTDDEPVRFASAALAAPTESTPAPTAATAAADPFAKSAATPATTPAASATPASPGSMLSATPSNGLSFSGMPTDASADHATHTGSYDAQHAAPTDASGLTSTDDIPNLQVAHEGTNQPGQVQHAAPPKSPYSYTPPAPTAAPRTMPASTYSAPMSNHTPAAHSSNPYAVPTNTQPSAGDRYGAQPSYAPSNPYQHSPQQQPQSAQPQHPQQPTAAQHPNAHYDIYGRDVQEQDPPAPMHSQSTGSYAPHTPSYTTPHASSSIDDRFTPSRDYHSDTAARAPQHVGPTYTIRPNDSFYSISETVYGSGSYFKALEEHNRENVPYSDRMRVGDKIETPSVAELEKQYPDLVPRRRNAAVAKTTLSGGVMTNASLHVPPGAKVYKVQQGDTLFDIARNELGKATRWAEIYDLNRDRLGDDFDFVAPGTDLIIPDNRTGASSGPLTTQSRQPYTR